MGEVRVLNRDSSRGFFDVVVVADVARGGGHGGAACRLAAALNQRVKRRDEHREGEGDGVGCDGVGRRGEGSFRGSRTGLD